MLRWIKIRNDENAKQCATSITENANSSLGELVTANLGVFQIVAQNTPDEYTGIGAFDKTSKEKTVFVTVKLQYKLKKWRLLFFL